MASRFVWETPTVVKLKSLLTGGSSPVSDQRSQPMAYAIALAADRLCEALVDYNELALARKTRKAEPLSSEECHTLINDELRKRGVRGPADWRKEEEEKAEFLDRVAQRHTPTRPGDGDLLHAIEMLLDKADVATHRLCDGTVRGEHLSIVKRVALLVKERDALQKQVDRMSKEE